MEKWCAEHLCQFVMVHYCFAVCICDGSLFSSFQFHAIIGFHIIHGLGLFCQDQQRKGRYFPQIIDHDLASYIDLRDIDRIEDYVDSGHLNERAGLKFSSRLVNQLAKYLNRTPQSTINKPH